MEHYKLKLKMVAKKVKEYGIKDMLIILDHMGDHVTIFEDETGKVMKYGSDNYEKPQKGLGTLICNFLKRIFEQEGLRVYLAKVDNRVSISMLSPSQELNLKKTAIFMDRHVTHHLDCSLFGLVFLKHEWSLIEEIPPGSGEGYGEYIITGEEQGDFLDMVVKEITDKINHPGSS